MFGHVGSGRQERGRDDPAQHAEGRIGPIEARATTATPAAARLVALGLARASLLVAALNWMQLAHYIANGRSGVHRGTDLIVMRADGVA